MTKIPTTERSDSRRELVLNLRQSQARFLQDLKTVTKLETSEIFQRLIGLAAQSEAERQNDPLFSTVVKKRFRSFTREPGDRKWVQVPVYLDKEDLVEGLKSLTSDSTASRSKTLRHLLADYMGKVSVPSNRRKSAKSAVNPGAFLKSGAVSTIAIVTVLLVGSLTVYFALKSGRSIEVGPHWAGTNASMVFDPHTHTRYSDGKLSPGDLVDLAVKNGCDAMVISDHSDEEGTVSDEQMQELQDLRGSYPDLLLFGGIELNIPSYGGREHAGLIAAPSVGAGTLQQLRDVAERSLRRAKNAGASRAFDKQLLQMIADYQSLSGNLLLVYNHPSRKDADIAENLSDLKNWNTHSPVFAAIEGAPGHQNARVTGSYEEPHLTEDRWDPVVAQVGGVWDELLSQGHQLWGALASSDYHNDKLDKAPCAFARTHLIVPEWSYRGALRALKTGTFWADHGRILNQLWFSVNVDGLEQVAYPGFIVVVGDRDSLGVLSLSFERGPGSMGQPLTIEIIGNCSSGNAEILVVEEIGPADSTFTTVVPLQATGQDGVSCFLRARVRLTRASAPDYMAYTNPIRLILN